MMTNKERVISLLRSVNRPGMDSLEGKCYGHVADTLLGAAIGNIAGSKREGLRSSRHLIPFPLILNQAVPSSLEILTVPVCMASP